ncbi:hypothetical protein VTJ83DRAFT_7232 [Remersonia thermophila]|uniref:DNA replication factor Cdt1 C-terminal domain-containing protein n=1 Tax=Remersonia thermophila TaxID=72144 RepID=A0ABR4D593_9PEZI
MPGVLRKTRATRSKLAPATPASTKLQAPAKETQIPSPFGPRSANIEIALPSRKRKAHDENDHSSKKLRGEQEQAQPPVPLTPASRKRKSVRFVDAEADVAPSTPVPAAAGPSTPTSRKRRLDAEDTSPEALLSRLQLQSPTAAASKKNKTTPHRRAPLTDFDLPRELNDLLDMHAAFLKTLTMQCAHAISGAPIDLRDLYDSITRAWGKRHVNIDDIRRCIGVLSWTPAKTDKASCSALSPAAPYYLVDYGRDKICIEFHKSVDREYADGGLLRVPKLNMDFEANLRSLWLSRSHDMPGAVFIGTLPKAPIKPCAAATKVGPLASKTTQTTLDAFKRDLAEKRAQQQAKQQAATATAAAPSSSSSSSSSTPQLSLLERIRLKESLLAQTASQQDSSEAAARRRALQRCPDVAALITMLCKAGASGPVTQARMSFTMAALLTRLRDSMAGSLGNEEAAQCVRLLASEVAPQWLRVVKIGARENVVVTVARQMTKVMVEERVKALLG